MKKEQEKLGDTENEIFSKIKNDSILSKLLNLNNSNLKAESIFGGVIVLNLATTNNLF